MVESLHGDPHSTREPNRGMISGRFGGPAGCLVQPEIVHVFGGMRIEFGDWLRKLGGRRRRIAETLAKGETTSVTAAKFRVSLGRISQLRRELNDDWERFHGESVASA